MPREWSFAYCSGSVRSLSGSRSLLVRGSTLNAGSLKSLKAMDDKFQDILDRLPEKPPRSRLEPYGDLIHELLMRGRTYRDVVRILAEECQVRVSSSTIHDFVRLRCQTPKTPTKREASAPTTRTGTRTREDSPQPDDVQARIAALKQRSASNALVNPEPFHYDADKPLSLPKRRE